MTFQYFLESTDENSLRNVHRNFTKTLGKFYRGLDDLTVHSCPCVVVLVVSTSCIYMHICKEIKDDDTMRNTINVGNEGVTMHQSKKGADVTDSFQGNVNL